MSVRLRRTELIPAAGSAHSAVECTFGSLYYSDQSGRKCSHRDHEAPLRAPELTAVRRDDASVSCYSGHPRHPRCDDADAHRRHGEDDASDGEPSTSPMPFRGSEDGDDNADEADEHTEDPDDESCGKRDAREDEPGQAEAAARRPRYGLRQRGTLLRPRAAVPPTNTTSIVGVPAGGDRRRWRGCFTHSRILGDGGGDAHENDSIAPAIAPLPRRTDDRPRKLSSRPAVGRERPPGRYARETTKPPVSRGFLSGGRYWDRTSDLFRVREARYRCANRPEPESGSGSRWIRDSNPCIRLCRPLPRLSANPPKPQHGKYRTVSRGPESVETGPTRADDEIRTRDPHLGKVMRYHCATSAFRSAVPCGT